MITIRKRFGHGQTKGLWFMKVDLIRDFYALNNRETSAWDRWRDAPPNFGQSILTS